MTNSNTSYFGLLKQDQSELENKENKLPYKISLWSSPTINSESTLKSQDIESELIENLLNLKISSQQLSNNRSPFSEIFSTEDNLNGCLESKHTPFELKCPRISNQQGDSHSLFIDGSISGKQRGLKRKRSSIHFTPKRRKNIAFSPNKFTKRNIMNALKNTKQREHTNEGHCHRGHSNSK